MKLKVIIFVLILICPSISGAAYKIYLKNGSVISGASSYEKKGVDIIINLGGGSVSISENDILKIEETGAPEKDFRSKETKKTTEKGEEAVAPPTIPSGTDRDARVNSLKAELGSLNSQIQAAEEEEARLAASINEKIGERTRYTTYQLRQLESEIAPLRQELLEVQQKKAELLQRKASVESEIRGVE